MGDKASIKRIKLTTFKLRSLLNITQAINENLTQQELLSRYENILKEDLFDQNSIIWARGPLLNIGKLQIIGHTHRKEINFDKEANALYIDTTAYGNNKLTAVIVENNEVLEILDAKSSEEDVNINWIFYL